MTGVDLTSTFRSIVIRTKSNSELMAEIEKSRLAEEKMMLGGGLASSGTSGDGVSAASSSDGASPSSASSLDSIKLKLGGLGSEPQSEVQKASVFLGRASDILAAMRKLNHTVNEQKTNFMDPFHYLTRSSANTMTDDEREAIDTSIKGLLLGCKQSIEQFEEEIQEYEWKSFDIKEHLKGVITILYDRLETVSNTFAEQRSKRLQMRLENSENYFGKKKDGSSAIEFMKKTEAAKKSKSDVNAPHLSEPDVATNLTEEEIKELEMENKTLLQGLDQLIDETREIERQVIEVAELQEQFSKKVIDQSSSIDFVVESAYSAQTMLRRGTSELEKATQSGVTFRILVLAFLLIASFSLLFLHWFS